MTNEQAIAILRRIQEPEVWDSWTGRTTLPENINDILIYDRKLTDKELAEYELDYLGTEVEADD